MPMGMENLMPSIDGDLEFYYLQLNKSSGDGDMIFFSMVIRFQYIFRYGVKFQGIILTGKDFLASFSSG